MTNYYIISQLLSIRTKLRYNTLGVVPWIPHLRLSHVTTQLKNTLPSHRKNPHGRILKRESKEQHLSTVSKSCPVYNISKVL